MWLLLNGQYWSRRISQACFLGVVPKNTLRFGRFRRGPRLSRWLDLGLAHYSTRAHIQTIQGRASGAKVKEARIQMQCHWGSQGSRGRCVSFPHTLRGAVVTSQVTCYQPGNLLRGSAPRDFVGGIVTLASSSYLCQDPKFRLHKGRQILSKTHVICLSI